MPSNGICCSSPTSFTSSVHVLLGVPLRFAPWIFVLFIVLVNVSPAVMYTWPSQSSHSWTTFLTGFTFIFLLLRNFLFLIFVSYSFDLSQAVVVHVFLLYITIAVTMFLRTQSMRSFYTLLFTSLCIFPLFFLFYKCSQKRNNASIQVSFKLSLHGFRISVVQN